MLVEAFASGVSVVGERQRRDPYVITRLPGIVVGEKDDGGWQRALAQLIDDRTKRDEFAARGVARAAREFAWPVVARRYLDFFDTVTGGPT